MCQYDMQMLGQFEAKKIYIRWWHVEVKGYSKYSKDDSSSKICETIFRVHHTLSDIIHVQETSLKSEVFLTQNLRKFLIFSS